MNLVFPMIVAMKYQSGTSNVQNKIIYQSNRSFNIPPSLGIPLAFDAFSFPGWREFHELSPPGGGAFDHQSDQITGLDFMLQVVLITPGLINHDGDGRGKL